MVITGHRLTFGLTPLKTIRESPLININKIDLGDEMLVTWEGKTYKYTVDSIEKVNKDATIIEEQTKNHMITLYTCTLLGSNGPRIMVRALPSE